MHDRYRRRLADVAIGERPTTIHLRVRRFRCELPSCPRRTFVEQVDGLTFRHGRRSQTQQQTLTAIGCFLAGRAGARLAAMLHCTVSPNTLLGWLTRRPDNLGCGQQLRLKRVVTRCPELADLRRHIHDFAAMMANLHGHLLRRWIKAAEGSGLPSLRAFARNLRKTHDPRNTLNFRVLRGSLEPAPRRGPSSCFVDQLAAVRVRSWANDWRMV
ncbi:transposase, partial [Streptomyces sp. 110]|nr:transposase [Streptomyces endocoffeicus]